MKKLKLEIELQYSAEMMHGGKKDKEAKKWFFDEVLFGRYLALVDSGDLDDELGRVKVIKIIEGGENEE